MDAVIHDWTEKTSDPESGALLNVLTHKGQALEPVIPQTVCYLGACTIRR